MTPPFECPECGAMAVDGYVPHMHDCLWKERARLLHDERNRSRRNRLVADTPSRFHYWWHGVNWQEVRWTTAAAIVGLILVWLILEGVNGEW